MFINNPCSLDPTIVFNLPLVVRAHNVPSIKKNLIFKRKVFVSVSNPETTMKTADVDVKGQMAKWNQKLEALYVFPLSGQSYG